MTEETYMVAGEKYRFKVSAVNLIGESELSNYVTIAMASPAAQPTTPTVNRDLSTLTSLFIEWGQGTPGDIPIDGYRLYMIEIATGIVTLEYDGSQNPDIYTYSIPNLVTSARYSVYV